MRWLIVFAAGIIAGIMLSRLRTESCPQELSVAEIVCLRDTVYDTVRVSHPEPAQVRALRRANIAVTVDSAASDSCAVEIEQKVFGGDSAGWRAVVSGAWVSLDTMEVRRPLIMTRESVVVNKPGSGKRWHIGPSAGVGYDGRRISPWIGVSVTFSLASF